MMVQLLVFKPIFHFRAMNDLVYMDHKPRYAEFKEVFQVSALAIFFYSLIHEFRARWQTLARAYKLFS